MPKYMLILRGTDESNAALMAGFEDCGLDLPVHRGPDQGRRVSSRPKDWTMRARASWSTSAARPRWSRTGRTERRRSCSGATSCSRSPRNRRRSSGPRGSRRSPGPRSRNRSASGRRRRAAAGHRGVRRGPTREQRPDLMGTARRRSAAGPPSRTGMPCWRLTRAVEVAPTSGQRQEGVTGLDVVELDVVPAARFPVVSGESPPVEQGGFALPRRPVEPVGLVAETS